MTHSKFANHWNPLFGLGSESRLVGVDHPRDIVTSQGNAPWVQNALSNQLSLLESALETLEDSAEKDEMSSRIVSGKAYLNKLRNNLDSPSDLEEGLDEWTRLGFLSDFLKTPDLSYEGLSMLLDSDDIRSFLGKETLSKIILSAQSIETKKSFERTLRPNPIDDFEAILEKQWGSARKNLDDLVAKLADPEARQWYAEELLKNPEKDKLEWIRKNLKNAEIQWGKFQGYAALIPQDAIEKVQIIDLQAQSILQEMMAERLEKRLAHVTAEAEALIQKWEPELAPETPDRLRKALAAAGGKINLKVRSCNLGDLPPAKAQSALKNWIKEFEAEAGTAVREIRDLDERLTKYTENKAELVETIRRKSNSVRQHMEKSASDESVAAMEAAIIEAKARPVMGDDTIIKGQIEDGEKFLQGLKDRNAEWRNDLNEQLPIETLRGEEILAMETHVGSLYSKIDGAERTRLAREALLAIGQAHSSKEILEKLTKALPGHVQIVEPAEFEAKYRRYTTTGSMVFYQKGDFWKIIVNRDQKETAEDVDFLKTQIGHELRHLEFEGNSPLREAWVRAFVGKLGNDEWEKIKKAYWTRYPEKNPPDSKGKIGPFGPNDWKNEDLLSELYAMVPDFSELSAEIQIPIQKGIRLAEFESNPELSAKWEKTFLSATDREKWIRIRETMAKTFPDLKSPEGEPIEDWSDFDVLAELYAIRVDSWENLSSLSSALAAYGIAGWMSGKSSGSDDEKFLGAEAKKGKKGEDGEEEDDLPKTKPELESELKQVVDDIKSLQGSPFIGSLPGGAGVLSEMKHYAEELQKKLAATKDDASLAGIEEGLKKIKEGLGEGEQSIKSQLMAVSESQSNPPSSALLALWKNTTFYSFQDFAGVFEHAKDYITRWSKRRSEFNKGSLSKLIFEGVNEGLALEAGSFQSGAWKEAIHGWEERIKSKDASKLRGYLEEQANSLMPDKGLVCAVINVMSEKGTMNWVDPNLWICLNKLQTDTKLDPNDKLLYEDEGYLHEKLKKALGSGPVMNKHGAFTEKNRQNTNAYDAKKREFVPVIKEAPDKVGEMLKKMLMNKKGTHDKKPNKSIAVDPAFYEMILENSIANGAYTAQKAMFYLLSGMACGLLKPSTGAKLAPELWSAYPVMYYFMANTDQFNTEKKIKAFVEKHFKEEYENCEIASEKSKFRSFYWTTMVNHPGVLRRISVTAKPGGGSWDHDWAESFAMCGDTSVFKTILKASSSEVTKKTMPPNIYAGFLQWFELNKSPSHKLLSDKIANYFMFKSIMSGAAYSKTDYVRDSGIKREKPPGEADSTNHPHKPTSWVDQSLNHLMMSIPNLAPLFKLAIDQQSSVNNSDMHLDNIKSFLKVSLPGEASWVDETVVDLDHFYDSIGLIVSKLLAHVSAESLTSTIQANLP